MNTRTTDICRVDVDGPVAVIGDIHGRSDLLAKLLKKLGKQMPVFFVGDLIDRGPDAPGVIELLMARGARGVRGNHEEWMRRWCAGQGFPDDVLHRSFGALATLQAYGLTAGAPWAPRFTEVPEAHRRFFSELPLVLDLHVSGTPYWVIHAGVHKNTPVEPGLAPDEVVPWLVEHEPWNLLWTGGHIDAARRLDRPVVFGHTPHMKPAATERGIAIDTGCGLWETGSLTAVVLPEQRFVSVR
jgi:serine/threonine protein phosphatase 1